MKNIDRFPKDVGPTRSQTQRTRSPLIEFFYLEGCPHWERGLVNLHEAMRLEGANTTVFKVLVTSGEDARKKLFLGSPTIRIDGVDLDWPEPNRRPFMVRLPNLQGR